MYASTRWSASKDGMLGDPLTRRPLARLKLRCFGHVLSVSIKSRVRAVLQTLDKTGDQRYQGEL